MSAFIVEIERADCLGGMALLSRGQMLGGGRYMVERLIGRGGMASVYLASDRTRREKVAVKLFAGDFVSGKRSDSSIVPGQPWLGAQITHPHLVEVYDSGRVSLEGSSYGFLVMEFIKGGTLAGLLFRRWRLPARKALPFMAQLASAVACLHEAGVLHGDIKAANVFLNRTDMVKLGDFDLARLIDSGSGSSTTAAMGTPAYLSPEVCRGESLTRKSDLYALGVLFWEMVTGTLPFNAKGVIDMARKHLYEPVPSARSLYADIPAELDQLITDMMAKDPHIRCQSANVVLARLQLLQA